MGFIGFMFSVMLDDLVFDVVDVIDIFVGGCVIVLGYVFGMFVIKCIVFNYLDKVFVIVVVSFGG